MVEAAERHGILIGDPNCLGNVSTRERILRPLPCWCRRWSVGDSNSILVEINPLLFRDDRRPCVAVDVVSVRRS